MTRFLYWHMNFHVEHHIFPSVPFYNLHRLRAAFAADLPPAPRGLVRAWAQMLPVLWRQRGILSRRVRPGTPAPWRHAADHSHRAYAAARRGRAGPGDAACHPPRPRRRFASASGGRVLFA